MCMLPQHIEQQIYHLPKSPKKSEAGREILTGDPDELDRMGLGPFPDSTLANSFWENHLIPIYS